jgi:AP-1 complex subunit sigma 1/2
VCELDLIFNFHKAYYILDEILIGGELQESSRKTILRVCTAQDQMMEENKEEAPVRGKRSSLSQIQNSLSKIGIA